MKIYHPIGNRRIFLIKKCAHILNYFVLVILSLFLKINFNKNEVIISNSFYAPWKEDKDFDNFYKKIKNLT
jgi:VanZ family protein